MIRLAAIYWHKVFYYQVCMYICITQVHIHIWIYVSMHVLVLFKALPPVCMKCSRSEWSGKYSTWRSQMLCLSQDSYQELYAFHTNEVAMQ